MVLMAATLLTPAPRVAADPGWSTASLSRPRSRPFSLNLGDIAVIGGGEPVEVSSNAVDIFDTATDRWSRIDLPTARTRPSVTIVGSTIVVAGGLDRSGTYTASADLFDSATQRWRSVALPRAWDARSGQTFVAGSKLLLGTAGVVDVLDVPSGRISSARTSAREAAGVAVVDARVVFAGGRSADGPTGAVDIYDSTADAWTTAQLAQPRSDLSVAVVGSRAIFAGGESDQGTSDVIDIYDASSGRWDSARLSSTRKSPAVLVVGSTVLLAGGQSSDAVDIYDAATRAWRTSRLSAARPVLGVVAGSNVVFATRNAIAPTARVPVSKPDPAWRVVDVFDSATGMWSTTQLPPSRGADVGYQVHGQAVGGTLAVAGEKVLFAGGSFGETHGGAGQYLTLEPSDAVDILDTPSLQWSTARLSAPAYAPAAVNAGNRALFTGRIGLGVERSMCSPCLNAARASDTVDIYDGATDTWTVKMLDRPRQAFTLTGGTQQVVLAGGSSADVDLARTIDVFNAANGQWSSATLPDGASASAAVRLGARAVLFDPTPAQLEIYDSQTRQWSSVGLPERRFARVVALEGAGDRGKVLVASASAGADTVDIYDAGTGELSTAHLSEARGEMAIAVVGTQVILAGGSGQHLSDAVDIYAADTDQWSVAALSQPRTLIRVAVVGQRALFVGGLAGSKGSQVVDMYHAATGAWSTAAASDRTSAVAVIGSRVLIGGAGSDILDVYDADLNAWSRRTLPRPLSGDGVAVVGDKVVFFPTREVPGPARVDVYDATQDRWSQAPVGGRPGPLVPLAIGPRLLLASASMADGKSDLVDVYDATADVWSSAQVSLARGLLTAVKAGHYGVLAGGSRESASDRVDIFDAAAGR